MALATLWVGIYGVWQPSSVHLITVLVPAGTKDQHEEGRIMFNSRHQRTFNVLAIAASSLAVGWGLAVAPAVPADAASAPTPPFTECPAIGDSPSCEILLVVNADNTVSVEGDPSVGPFDGSDDTLVGIINNSSKTVKAVTVSGPGSDLSGFDGDGICRLSPAFRFRILGMQVCVSV